MRGEKGKVKLTVHSSLAKRLTIHFFSRASGTVVMHLIRIEEISGSIPLWSTDSGSSGITYFLTAAGVEISSGRPMSKTLGRPCFSKAADELAAGG